MGELVSTSGCWVERSKYGERNIDTDHHESIYEDLCDGEKSKFVGYFRDLNAYIRERKVCNLMSQAPAQKLKKMAEEIQENRRT